MALPADVQAALDKYDDDISSGAIQFGPEGFADTYPRQCMSDDTFNRWIASHVHYGTGNDPRP